jgi:hypothetical protein
MLLNESIFPAVQAASLYILDKLMACQNAELSFLYFYYREHFVIVVRRAGAPVRYEILENFGEKTGEKADIYFRQFAAAAIGTPPDQMGFYQTSAISPAEGLANGAVGIARQERQEDDALASEALSASSFLIGQLLKTFGEITAKSTRDTTLPDLTLHRALDALTILFGVQVPVTASLVSLDAHRERLVILIIAMFSMAADAQHAEAIKVEIESHTDGQLLSIIQKPASLKSPFFAGRDTDILRLAVSALNAKLSIQRDNRSDTSRVELAFH